MVWQRPGDLDDKKDCVVLKYSIQKVFILVPYGPNLVMCRTAMISRRTGAILRLFGLESNWFYLKPSWSFIEPLRKEQKMF